MATDRLWARAFAGPLAFIFLVVVLVNGCATSPDKISPTYVSPIVYSHLTCEQIRQETMRINRRISEVAGVQRSERNKDSAATAVGIVLFWPALFFLMGKDKEEELARLKGEYEALQQVAIEKNCAFASEMGITEVGEEPAGQSAPDTGAAESKEGAEPIEEGE